MKVRSLGPLPADALVYRPRDDRWRLAIVCKSTQRLVPGQATLATAQEPLHADDLLPIKPRVDIVLVGTAHAPRRAPARSIPVRLVVGDLEKSLEACLPRTVCPDGALREGALVQSIPLRWELAAGGPGTANPVGMAQDVHPAFGTRVLPQIQPLGWFPAEPSDEIPIVGFGPISPAWPGRRDRLGDRAASFRHGDWSNEVLGDGFDLLYFQAAPPDQQLESLRPDERIILENLLPDSPRLVTNLAGFMPRAFLHRSPGGISPVALRADTLCIDADRGLCTVTYRGHLDLVTRADPGIVYIVLEEPGQPIGVEELEARLGALAASDISSESWAGAPVPPSHSENAAAAQMLAAFGSNGTTEIDLDALSLPPALPFQPKQPRAPSRDADDDEARTAVMNVAGLRAEVERRSSPPGSAGERDEKTGMFPNTGLGPSPVLPFVKPASPPATPAVPPVPGPLPAMAPPPTPPMAASPPPSAPTFGPPPSAMRSTPTSLPAWVVPPAPVAPIPVAAAPVAPTPAPTPTPAPWDQRRLGAAPAAPRPDASERPAGKSIELIWFDPAFIARMKKHPQWGPMFKPAPKPPAPERGKPPPPPPSPEAIEEAQRADIFGILSCAEPSSQGELATGGGNGASEGAPLHLVAGTLSFPLDDIELLKATTAAAAPLATTDKKLKELLELVEGVLKMPLEGAPEVATSFVQRIREAWSSANRILPPDYLVTHTEWVLLNQRHYQKRELLDQAWVRALFSAEGSSSPLPAYVSAKLSKRLPLFRQFPARLVVEVLPQQDMYESSPIALRVVALARQLDAATRQTKTRSQST
ncbi:DUF2169 family type VI secretion system accessory protein [Polyangium spumosum]|uniref:DUF2169 domain-containing protein n=1 Tax=Polyangium spumosum TaxID=889282 RepID=A0A6N7Q595_9BACT|nr:DUF2169 domain-containing protein [Polyangium spumosum]MRG98050.1 DUF2169 domain-containing protein [Polyangium spumosum]